MEKLIAHIQDLSPVSDEEIGLIQKAFQEKKLAKKEFILKAGDVSQHMRFIDSGALRTYYLDEEGKEFVQSFGIEGWWLNDLYSYLSQSPATQFIQATEPSVIFQIHRDRLEELFKEVPSMERFFRIKMQSAYQAAQHKNLQVKIESAEERYADFRQRYPQLEQRFPQYMIASYLGLTPEHLSYIRRKALK
ncbi:Crp/Fnr family transcriptional regulator [Croceimicrobium sp.]|uniref:Crp/Fnr family transcriptional regulator n=1 Tax=Croceimicrobium sp. TaxID=2828340 RepID=UPI003BAA50EF